MTRTFVVVDGSGKYQAEKPIAAAKKAAARLFKKTTMKNIRFSIRDTSTKKIYHYKASNNKDGINVSCDKAQQRGGRSLTDNDKTEVNNALNALNRYFVQTYGDPRHIEATNSIDANIDNASFKKELLNKIKILLPLQKQRIVDYTVGNVINRHIDVLTRVAYAISYNDPNQNDIDNYRDLIVFLNIILFDVPQLNQIRNIDANIKPDDFKKELDNTLRIVNSIDSENINEDMRQHFKDIKIQLINLNDKIQQESNGPKEDQ